MCQGSSLFLFGAQFATRKNRCGPFLSGNTSIFPDLLWNESENYEQAMAVQMESSGGCSSAFLGLQSKKCTLQEKVGRGWFQGRRKPIRSQNLKLQSVCIVWVLLLMKGWKHLGAKSPKCVWGQDYDLCFGEEIHRCYKTFVSSDMREWNVATQPFLSSHPFCHSSNIWQYGFRNPSPLGGRGYKRNGIH